MITEPHRGRIPLAVAAICVAALATMAGLAQEPTKHIDPRKDYALIYGTVWDTHDRPAYGVKVMIRPANEKKARWEVISDHAGEFAQRVPPGKQDYVLWAEAKMPKGAQKPQTVAHVENDERVDVSLHLNGVAEPGAKQ
ncbi:MAG: hypothetical protein ACRD3E_08420 [Terriglobales bacterium]